MLQSVKLIVKVRCVPSSTTENFSEESAPLFRNACDDQKLEKQGKKK
jgi:hypothetical protein